MLHYLASMARPFYWGVCHLEIDEAALDNRVLRVQAIQAIMPDGLYVSTPPPKLELLPFKTDAEKAPLRIHLCVPEASVADRQGPMARFTVDPGGAIADADPDADEGQVAVTIPRLRPNLKLAATEAGTGGQVRLPIAEVEYSDSAFRLTDFVPPHFKTHDARFLTSLMELCQDVARKVRGKSSYLLEMIRSPVGSANRPRFERQLSSLMAALPAFEAHIESGQVHPYDIYVALCTLSVQVATVGTIDEIPRYPRYDHDNIIEIFSSVAAGLQSAIDLGVQENFTEYRFDGEGHNFTMPFREEWVGRKLVLGFLGQPTPEIIAWAENCYIGTDSHIESMSKNRDVGAKRIRDDQHEGLRRRPGTILYTLDEGLRRIEPGETVHVYNPLHGPSDSAPTRVVLYVQNAA